MSQPITSVVRGTTTALVKERERAQEKKRGQKPVSPEKRSRRMRFRLGIMALALIALYFLVLHRFYALQIEDPALAERGARQSAGKIRLGAGGENHLDGHRGYIFDRNGYELAISVEVPSVFVHPRQIQEAQKVDEVASKLAAILDDRAEGEIRDVLERDAAFVWLSRKITPQQGERIRELRLPGVGLKRESKRYYPAQDLAGQILGFAGMDNVGLAGIESAWDETLRGGTIELEGLRDARGQMLLTLETPMLNELEGSSVALTIDQTIQRVTETAIERAATEFGAKAAYGIVMDPKTGELLALASWPRFNPNRFRDFEMGDWRNRAALDVFEPGSVVKPLIYSMALDRGLVEPHEPIDAEGGRLRFTADISISDTHTVENLDAEGVVVHSSNIGAYKLAKRMGKEAYHQGLLSFGFGQPTGVGIQGEGGGILRPPNKWYEIDFANLAFGQGLSVSPLQLAVAFSVIANGGELVRPMLFKEVRDATGKIVREWHPEVRHRVVGEDAARKTRTALEKVVTEGTAMRAWVEGYPVGGKTGTSQKAHNGRYVNRWIATFAGMAPIDDPDVVVIVMVDEPRKSHLGGMVSAPAFAEIVSQVLPYRDVYPNEVYAGSSVTWPTMIEGESKPDAAADADTDPGASEDASNTPSPFERAGIPAPEEDEAESESVVLAPGRVRVPDFSGMTLAQALDAANVASVHIDPRETGYVSEQWPAPGAAIDRDGVVQLTLARRYRQTHLGFDDE